MFFSGFEAIDKGICKTMFQITYRRLLIAEPGQKPDYAIDGRFLMKLVACSKAWASYKTKSSLFRPTIWMPTGRPSGVKPAGTEAAGFPVAEIYQQDFIQSM